MYVIIQTSMQKINLESPQSIGFIDPNVLRRFHHSLDPSIGNFVTASATLISDRVEVTVGNSRAARAFIYEFWKKVIELEVQKTEAPIIYMNAMRKILPPRSTTIESASMWHTDSRRYAVSRGLGTEFLRGDLSVPENTIIRSVGSMLRSPTFEPTADNLFIPDDGEIMAFDTGNFHRSAINKTDHIIDRLFVQAIVMGVG